MIFSYYSTPDLFVGVILICCAIGLYFMGRNSLSCRLFSFLTLSVAIWSISVAISVSTQDPSLYLYLIKHDHILGTLMPTIFLLFAFSYPNDSKINKKILAALLGIELLFVYLLFFTDTIILRTFTLPNLEYLGWSYGQLAILFNLYLAFAWVFGISLLIKKFKATIDSKTRQNIRQVILAVVIGVTPPVIITVLLPQIGIFDYYWSSPVSGLIWILLITYAITRHQLFNIRIIAVQLVTFTLWIMLFVRTIFAPNSHDALVDSILLIITIIFGVTLIRSVLYEINQKKRIEELERQLRGCMYERRVSRRIKKSATTNCLLQ